MKVYTKEIHGLDVLCYEYECSPDMGFCFHLLSEVGEPWQAQAKYMCDGLAIRRGKHVATAELCASPWYADVLTN